MKNITETQKVLLSMFTSKCDTNMLDSGGAYGYQYQRNQKRDFLNEPQAKITCEYGRVDVVVNTFHFLNNAVSFNADMQERYDEFANSEENKNKTHFQCVAEFLETMDDIAGIYGDGEPVTEYTYNTDTLLDHDFQFTYFTKGQDRHRTEYVVIFLHTGCDARSGFSDPKFFTCNEELSILNYNRAAICSSREETQPSFLIDQSVDYLRWFCDDGHSFTQEDEANVSDLDEYEIIDQEHLDKLNEDLPENEKQTFQDFIGKGYIVVTNNQVLCPIFGTPLEAFPE